MMMRPASGVNRITSGAVFERAHFCLPIFIFIKLAPPDPGDKFGWGFLKILP